MLYIIGLGLYDERDISLKGLEAVKGCHEVYAEFYTAMLQGSSLSAIERLTGKDVRVLRREEVEEDRVPLQRAEEVDVALLVPGDPLIATTHTEILVDARRRGIETRVIHSSSIISAAPGLAGLQAYKFGRIITIPFTEDNYFPLSPYLNIRANLENSSHSLVLLDIQAHRERYMTANEGLSYLMKASGELDDDTIGGDTLAVVIARAGSEEPLVRADRIMDLIDEDLGDPLHCLVIPAGLHFVEAEYLVEVAGAPEDLVKGMIL
ncbi:diphthine synthase [Methanothermobacter wolfeii]|uniref:Diphthine synthase n=1 Tax=Methanothermobacter wolfeii TaxID=145261 RepID=A0A9E7RVL6_METWO|nr:diphthine synthase [Methanothermobacter wolfeii]MDI6841512.1 diphthine synthase [Methanothermobacter wolfeii]NLM02839.1 diphthine synthase [Methanothermobacter wolfeii]UXH32113.1 diphthine synthase [Methanothermobacter wolfeii]SCM56241.1 Diphthine synthase {ECO:0000255/HAMAP-Rule:MF_01084} [Methanothermobacter wolfeii]